MKMHRRHFYQTMTFSPMEHLSSADHALTGQVHIWKLWRHAHESESATKSSPEGSGKVQWGKTSWRLPLHRQWPSRRLQFWCERNGKERFWKHFQSQTQTQIQSATKSSPEGSGKVQWGKTSWRLPLHRQWPSRRLQFWCERNGKERFWKHFQSQTQTQIHIFNQDCRKVVQVYLSRLLSWIKIKKIKSGHGDGERKHTEKKEKKMIKGKRKSKSRKEKLVS